LSVTATAQTAEVACILEEWMWGVPSAESDAENPVVRGVHVHKPSGDHLQLMRQGHAIMLTTEDVVWRDFRIAALGFIIPSWQAPTSHLELKPAHL